MAVNDRNEVVIVGGGITGLSAAYMCAKAGKKVTVLEAGDKFGGLLNTFEIGGNRLEHYYHHFFTHDAELNWLIKDLGIEDKLFFQKTTMGVFRKGKLFDFNTPTDLLKFSPISFIDKIRFGFTSLYLGKVAEWRKYEHVPGLAWLNKWAGKSSTASLWRPLFNIKFGPYANEVPLSWMIGRLRQRINSGKVGDERLGYIHGSLQVLLDALMARLKELNVTLLNNQPVKEVVIDNNKLTAVKTTDRTLSADQFLFTIPGIYVGEMLRQVPTLAKRLSDIKYFGAVCVILELTRKLSDIYWLNIADEGYPFGGIIEHTNLIPAKEYNGSHIVYLSRYFALEEDIAEMPEKDIEERMLVYLPKIYPEFDRSWIKKVYVFKTKTGATVCDLNFSQKVPDCKTEVENLYISNMSHIYPDERSTNNSIRIAAEACKVMGIDASYVPEKYSLSGKIGFEK